MKHLNQLKNSTLNVKGLALKSIAIAIAQSVLFAPHAASLPSNPEILAGDIQVNTNATGMIITQASQRAVLEYQQFNIGSSEKVQFVQPSSNSLTLNKVSGPDASTIAGQLSANGHIYLVNPNGVFFTPTAQVDLSGLVVTTLDITTEDFIDGDFELLMPGPGKIENQGRIEANQLLAFVAPLIENSGQLMSNEQLTLINADQVIITPAGERTGFTVPQNALMQTSGSLVNSGDISGQWVALTAQSVDSLHNSVIENSGTIAELA